MNPAVVEYHHLCNRTSHPSLGSNIEVLKKKVHHNVYSQMFILLAGILSASSMTLNTGKINIFDLDNNCANEETKKQVENR